MAGSINSLVITGQKQGNKSGLMLAQEGQDQGQPTKALRNQEQAYQS